MGSGVDFITVGLRTLTPYEVRSSRSVITKRASVPRYAAKGMPLRRHANRPTKNRLFPLKIVAVRKFVSVNNMQSLDDGKLAVVFLNPASWHYSRCPLECLRPKLKTSGDGCCRFALV